MKREGEREGSTRSGTLRDGSTAIGRILRALYRTEVVWDALSGGAMLLIMLALVADALGRYLFTMPIEWAHDLVSRLLLPCVFFFTLSSALRLNQHVNIDFVFETLGDRARNMAIGMGSLLALVFFLLVGWLGARVAYQAFVAGERMSGAIEWPVWIYAAFVPLGAIPLVIRLALRMRESTLRARRGEPPLSLAPRVEDEPGADL